MSRRLLVTGGSGFVGRQVVRALAGRGVPMKLLLRTAPPAPPGDAEVVTTADLFAQPRAWWEEVLCDIDTVVHVAWYTEPGKYLQDERNLDCLAGTLELARACVAARVRRFVGIGTCFEYDLDRGMLPVDTPLRPTTLYGACKASAYQTLARWFEVHGVEFAWCRLFYLYGEGEDPRRFIPYLRGRLAAGEAAELTGGQQIRDYLDVAEAGRQIAQVALGLEQGPVNICSGVPVTVRQMAERVADEYGRRDLLRFGARPDNPLDAPCVVGVR